MDIFRKKFLDGLVSRGKKEFSVRDMKMEAARFRLNKKDINTLCGDLTSQGLLRSVGKGRYRRWVRL